MAAGSRFVASDDIRTPPLLPAPSIAVGTSLSTTSIPVPPVCTPPRTTTTPAVTGARSCGSVIVTVNGELSGVLRLALRVDAMHPAPVTMTLINAPTTAGDFVHRQSQTTRRRPVVMTGSPVR